jgi:hypothetical protein
MAPPPMSARAAPIGGGKSGAPSPLRPTVSNTTPIAQPRTSSSDLPSFAPKAPAPGAPPAAPVAAAPTAPAGAPRPANPPAAGARRAPINPFLANDPNQKAKRLARALVSDMVAYQPQKREEGLRDGTLKQIFREEIKKSYDEYLDQVGKEFAEGTTHFQDALNEVLASGQKLF